MAFRSGRLSNTSVRTMFTSGIEVEYWLFADTLLNRRGYTSIQKRVFLPFVPRVGDGVILRDKSDWKVGAVTIDYDDNVIGVMLEPLTNKLDDEIVEWMLQEDGWTIE